MLPIGDLDPRTAGPLTDAGATCHHAVRRARSELGEGSTVVVMGIGGLGWFAVQILKATTPARIVAVDIDPARRAIAAELGADEVLDGSDEHELRGALAGVADGGVDAVIDIVGSDSTIATGLGALRRAGAFVLVGSGGGGFRRPWFGGLPREATITAVQGSSIDDARQVIALAAARPGAGGGGRVPPRPGGRRLRRPRRRHPPGPGARRPLKHHFQGMLTRSPEVARSVETSPNTEYV